MDAGDVLAYGISSSPTSDIMIDPTTGIIRWTPKSNDTFLVTITANDQQATISYVFQIMVLRVNRAPTIVHYLPETSSLKMTIAQKYGFNVEAIDKDGDRLEYRWLVDGELKGDNSSFLFNSTFVGSHIIIVEVSDGTETVIHNWEMTVREGVSVEKTSSNWFLSLMIIIVIMGMTIGVYLIRRRSRKMLKKTVRQSPNRVKRDEPGKKGVSKQGSLKILRVVSTNDLEGEDKMEMHPTIHPIEKTRVTRRIRK
jgi:hypothetical protein